MVCPDSPLRLFLLFYRRKNSGACRRTPSRNLVPVFSPQTSVMLRYYIRPSFACRSGQVDEGGMCRETGRCSDRSVSKAGRLSEEGRTTL